MKHLRLYCLFVIACFTHSSHALDLNGVWVGFYGYGNSNEIVECAMVIEQEGTHLKGRMIERQTFGKEPSVGLSANLTGMAGSASGDQKFVVFEKTYDGSGGQTHSVKYTLSLEQNDVLVGLWTLNQGQLTGKVMFRRVTTDILADLYR